jgi:hypothetical protein
MCDGCEGGVGIGTFTRNQGKASWAVRVEYST